jgi:hypothetical protein
MNKTYLALALLITGFLFVGNAYVGGGNGCQV